MQRRKFLTAATAVASASAFGILGTSKMARAEETVLRIGTLAPKGSSWMRVFDAWNNTLAQKTNNRLKLHFYSGGAAGDERDAVRKAKAGQLDGALVTTMGLGQIVRSVLVLQAPGVCNTYKQIDAVRAQMAGDLENQFLGADFKLLGWGDAGQGRVFSNAQIVKPEDMRHTRMWSWKDDPTWQAILDAAQVNGVALGLPEVYPALRTDRIDAFPSTAIAAVAFQWYTKAAFVTKEPRNIVIGATVIRKDKFTALPDDLKAILTQTGKDAHSALQASIRRDDDKALKAILGKGVQSVTTSAGSAQWNDVMKKARESLVGKLYSGDLLRKVEHIAGAAG
jgi:TRAP-type C4-dicarboxylate transport system substrate-binding protein